MEHFQKNQEAIDNFLLTKILLSLIDLCDYSFAESF